MSKKPKLTSIEMKLVTFLSDTMDGLSLGKLQATAGELEDARTKYAKARPGLQATIRDTDAPNKQSGLRHELAKLDAQRDCVRDTLDLISRLLSVRSLAYGIHRRLTAVPETEADRQRAARVIGETQEQFARNSRGVPV